MVITEFGVPSSMASAHYGPQGRDQRGHSEPEQMKINADLLDAIREVGLSGAFLFQWIDEWFKFTWNTVDYEIPWDRRSLWNNQWTNEAHFGIVAADAGPSAVATLDGDDREWIENGSQVVFEGSGQIREVRAVKDESYLYLRIRTDQVEPWRNSPLVIGIDLLPGSSGGLPETDGAFPESDYAVTLGPNTVDGKIMVRASNDPYGLHYALLRDYEAVEPADYEEGSGVWNVQRLLLDRPQFIPETGETLPAEVGAPGEMTFGKSNPEAAGFDSRATWYSEGNVIEIRLPHQAIGFSDPSSLQAYVINNDRSIDTHTVERIRITLALDGEVFETAGYMWEPWQTVQWHERIKSGTETFAGAVITSNSK